MVLGSTELISGHAVLFLAQEGHDVTITARKPVSAATPLAKLPMIKTNYVSDDLSQRTRATFDVLIFAAGNDIRHVPPGGDETAHWQRANIEGVP
jgi:hypothetical protein